MHSPVECLSQGRTWLGKSLVVISTYIQLHFQNYHPRLIYMEERWMVKFNKIPLTSQPHLLSWYLGIRCLLTQSQTSSPSELALISSLGVVVPATPNI